jgi:hypothetical protein
MPKLDPFIVGVLIAIVAALVWPAPRLKALGTQQRLVARGRVVYRMVQI